MLRTFRAKGTLTYKRVKLPKEITVATKLVNDKKRRY